ncbi:MAG: tetratricopeptide repeat protein [Cytophagales bacterium]|nr:tetratricopeptide repeat protein [Cytophagales bacterium]
MSRVSTFWFIFFFIINFLQAQDARENFKFAKFKYDNGHFQESLEFLDKALEEDSLYVNALYLRAEVRFELGQFYNAVLDINRILKLKNSNAVYTGNYYLTRGKSFLSLKDYSNAENDFDKAFELLSDDPNLFYYRAKLSIARNAYNQALEEIDVAIQIKSDNPDFYSLRSEIKIKLLNPVPDSDDYQSVLGDINVAIALDPDHPNNYLIRSNFLKSMGEVAAALEDYNTVIELSPKKEEAYTSRGVIKMNNYEYRSAALDFTKSIIINPDDERNYRYRGLCYNNLNNFADALKDFTKSIDLLTILLDDSAEKEPVKNTLAETYLLRGHCLNLMGNNAQACRDFLMAHNLGIRKGLNYYRKFCGIY